MARAYGSRAQMALAYESVYGTAPASGYFQMPFASSGLGAEQPLIDNELIGYGRDPLAPARDAITVNGDVVVPVDLNALGHWLKGIFGQPNTTGGATRTHTYNSGGLTLPSMAIQLGYPEVPAFDMCAGVRANTLRVTAQRSGNLQATVGLIGQSETRAGATAAGTPAAIALTRFNHFNGAISRNGTPLATIVSADFTYSNNLEPVEVIRSDGLIADADPTIASLTGSITARFADTVLYDQAVAGTSCELAFGWTRSASESFTLTAHSVFLPRPRVSVNGPGGIQVTFDWQASLAASPARMCTAVLVNAVVSY